MAQSHILRQSKNGLPIITRETNLVVLGSVNPFALLSLFVVLRPPEA